MNVALTANRSNQLEAESNLAQTKRATIRRDHKKVRDLQQ